jgi:hypothetical protein
MRLDLVPLRILMKAGSAVALCLLFAPVSYAAPGPRRNVVGRACAANSATVHKLARHPKSPGGPVALPSKRALSGLSDVTARLRRATYANDADDDQAIQSDTSAARVESDDRRTPVLRPLGVLAGCFDRLTRPDLFSPRSPRGPPIPS